MANNPFNAASSTANALASASPATDQFANFGRQNNPFNPQPPRPTNISNVSGNQFTLGVQKGNPLLQPEPRAPREMPTVQPTSYGTQATGPNMAAPALPVTATTPSAPNAYSTTTAPLSQQQGLIRGAIGRQN
jgi:hypothetical protein